MPRVPETKVQFFNVPWDSGYRNIRYFSSKAGRDSWFAARNHWTFPDDAALLNIQHAQPVKEGVPYTVATTWDNLHNFNYMRFKNSAYDDNDGWIYCFITGWAYASEHSCTVSFVRDVWINNVDKFIFPEQFVERETTDTITDLPEPVNINHYVHPDGARLSEFHGSYVYMIFYNYDFQNPDATPYCMIDGVRYPIGLTATTDPLVIDNIIHELVDRGHDGDIINVYAVPHEFCQINSPQNVEFPQSTGTVSRSHGSYNPRNAKCLRYPYCYYEVFDELGGSQIFRWEDDGGEFNYRIDGGLGLSAYAMISPTGDNNHANQQISHSILGTIGWSANGLQSWLAQNTDNIKSQESQKMFDTVVGIGATAASVGVGIAGTAMSGGALAPVALGAVGAGIGTGLNTFQSLSDFQVSQNQMINQAKYISNNGSPPNGSIMGLMTQGKLGFWGRAVYPSASEFRALDDFFTRYGYTVNRLKTLDMSRSGYYFVKTNGAVVRGACPQSDRDTMASILDRGVTFWSKDDIGEYV